MNPRPDLALVTGAAGGLGRTIVEHLLAAGRGVLATDRSLGSGEQWAAGLGARYGASFRFAPLDVTDEAAVLALGAELGAAGQSVGYLVNNAGIQAQAPLGELTTRRWQLVLDVNLLGTFLLSRQFVPGMAERGFGRVVNLSSYYASNPAAGQSAYAASKAGIVGFTRSLALDHASHGVTANVVSPGLIWHENLKAVYTEDEFTELAAGVPVGRVGRPEEVVGAVDYLLSDTAGYVTGQVLHVNGGLYLG